MTAGAGPLYVGTPLKVSRDMSRLGEGLQRHVARLPPAPDGTCPETEGFRDDRTLGIGWLRSAVKTSAGTDRARACLLTRRRLTPRPREDVFSRRRESAARSPSHDERSRRSARSLARASVRKEKSPHSGLLPPPLLLLPRATAPLRMAALSIALSLIVVHCGSRFVGGEVDAEEQSPPETASQRMLNRKVVGRHRERGACLMRTRALSATATLVGKTQEQVRAVGHRRDVDYLRDPATASMRAGSPTAGTDSRIRRPGWRVALGGRVR